MSTDVRKRAWRGVWDIVYGVKVYRGRLSAPFKDFTKMVQYRQDIVRLILPSVVHIHQQRPHFNMLCSPSTTLVVALQQRRMRLLTIPHFSSLTRYSVIH
jgi:hypothetical protein